jgi:hypothetical protein
MINAHLQTEKKKKKRKEKGHLHDNHVVDPWETEPLHRNSKDKGSIVM